MNNHYVYILTNPFELINIELPEYNLYIPYMPFYVGKAQLTTKKRESRLINHLKEAFRYSNKVKEWKNTPKEFRTRKNYYEFFKNFNLYKVRKILKVIYHTSKPRLTNVSLFHIDNLSEERAFEIEKDLIKTFRQFNINITNLTDGGTGGNTSKYRSRMQKEIASSKIIANLKSRPMTEKRLKQYKKIGEMKKGKTFEELYGKERAEEIKLKINRTRKINRIKKNAPPNTFGIDIHRVEELVSNANYNFTAISRIINKPMHQVRRALKRVNPELYDIVLKEKYKRRVMTPKYRIIDEKELREKLIELKTSKKLQKYFKCGYTTLKRNFSYYNITRSG